MSTTSWLMTWRPTSALLRRRTSLADRGEAGFTLVELMVTMAVMSIVATSVMAVAFRSFTTTSTITNRRDVLTDGRHGDRPDDEAASTRRVRRPVSERRVHADVRYLHRRRAGYDRVAGDGLDIPTRWSSPATAARISLRSCRRSSARLATDAGCTTDPFTYTSHGGVVDQVTIDLTFVTNTSTIDLISDVQLRNAEE